MNIFERASRKALRFESPRGFLTTEQLWDLKLTSRNGVDLDSLARSTNQELKQVAEESFVSTASNPIKVDLELKLDILKHIIAAKLEAAEKSQKAAANKVERDRLTAILYEKKDQEMSQLSAEEIQARIDQLSD